MKTKNTFAFRGECQLDILLFLQEAHLFLAQKYDKDPGFTGFIIVKNMKPIAYDPESVDPDAPGTYVEIDTTMNLIEVGRLMRKVPDGHVMLETVNFLENYTGLRQFGRRLKDLHNPTPNK